jgi:gentisate 1,2-dioxygenase
MDVLDVPLVEKLDSTFFSCATRSPIPPPAGRSDAHEASRPVPRALGGRRITPAYTARALAAAHRSSSIPGTPLDGRSRTFAQRREAGTTRHTASAIYSVVRVRGVTEIGDTRLEWSEKDVFAGWEWHSHANRESHEDAILYSVAGAPALRALDLYREQRREVAAVSRS